MRDTIDVTTRAEIQKPAVRSVSFVQLDLPGGTIRSCTGSRNLVWGGFTWLANARFAAQAGVIESADGLPRRMALTLSGVDQSLVAQLLAANVNYSSASLYDGFCDEAWELIAEPFEIAAGLLMSGPRIAYTRGAISVELSLERWSIRGNRDSVVLCAPQTQRLRYPTDTGVDRVAYIATQELQWGGQYGMGGTRVTGPIEYTKEK